MRSRRWPGRARPLTSGSPGPTGRSRPTPPLSRPGHTSLRVVLSLAVALTMRPGLTAAQEGDVSFPSTESGQWQGLLDLSGSFSIDSESEDGSFTVTDSDVIGSTTISLELEVDPEGRVTGTMPVKLHWFDEAAGAAADGDPFHLLHDHRQHGELTLTGTAARLVARGTLTEATDTWDETPAGFEHIEEVSGSEERDVEWVFALERDGCERLTGRLTEMSGSSLLPAVLDNGSGSVYHNGLTAELLLWPTSDVTPTALRAALDEVIGLADLLRESEIPEASLLRELVAAWTDLQAEVRTLGDCQTPVAWDPAFARGWLVAILGDALDTARETVDVYDAAELMDLWRVGKEQQALDGSVIVDFMDALYGLAVEAVGSEDLETATNILDFLSGEGYPELAKNAAREARVAP
jgi:hypothetical protein